MQHLSVNENVSTPMGFSLSQAEIIRVVMQFLSDVGYSESVDCLEKESTPSTSNENMGHSWRLESIALLARFIQNTSHLQK